MTNKAYVVHRGEAVDNREIPATAFSREDVAREVFDSLVAEGLSDINTGMFVTEVADIPDDRLAEVYDNTAAVVASGFAGFTTKRLAAHQSKIEDWDADAFTAGEDVFEDDEDESVVHL